MKVREQDVGDTCQERLTTLGQLGHSVDSGVGLKALSASNRALHERIDNIDVYCKVMKKFSRGRRA